MLSGLPDAAADADDDLRRRQIHRPLGFAEQLAAGRVRICSGADLWRERLDRAVPASTASARQAPACNEANQGGSPEKRMSTFILP